MKPLDNSDGRPVLSSGRAGMRHAQRGMCHSREPMARFGDGSIHVAGDGKPDLSAKEEAGGHLGGGVWV